MTTIDRIEAALLRLINADDHERPAHHEEVRRLVREAAAPALWRDRWIEMAARMAKMEASEHTLAALVASAVLTEMADVEETVSEQKEAA